MKPQVGQTITVAGGVQREIVAVTDAHQGYLCWLRGCALPTFVPEGENAPGEGGP